MEGLVTANMGSRYEVTLDDGSRIDAVAKGNLRIKGVRTTNPVAVGDRVTVVPAVNSPVSYITAIAPRRNYIIRRASNLSKESHIIGANLDLALLVCSPANPATATTFIDRFLATAEAYSVPAMLVINKMDLADSDPDAAAYAQALEQVYTSIGYRVMLVSTLTGQGIAALAEALRGRTTLLSGNSGVGKSSLINALVPGAEVTVAQVSDAHHTGMHTTTNSRMYFLPDGGVLIDTPGVRGFGTLDFDRREVGHYFPEIFAQSHHCRFGDCLHLGNEPGCAVLEALNQGTIPPSRYDSYVSILTNDTPGNTQKYR